jgi:thiosulfate/3-mercaptopyruvate sulfurtransferase
LITLHYNYHYSDMSQSTTSLINATELAQFIGRSNVVILDARGGADAFERYLKGHLKGAYFIDLETELSEKKDPKSGGRHPLPSLTKFGKVLGNYGIDPASTVIVYDDKSGANAASRVWWMLKAIGHQEVKVVNGGYAAIVHAQCPISTEPTEKISNASFYPVPEKWILPTVDIKEVQAASKDHSKLIIDVRENYRYRGESEPIDLVAGHIPSAANVPYLKNLNQAGSFISREELKELYKPVLEGKDIKNVIVHCGSGVTACHTLLALEEAGVTSASLYVGSWSEWSRNDLPMEKE